MKRIDRIRALLACTRGATAIEYGFMAAFIAIAAVSGFTALGNGVGGLYDLVKQPFGW
jgi:Flp pilus assembly pilin Flp